jgi:hypothetical protein
LSTFQKTLSNNKLILALCLILLTLGVYKDALFLIAAPMYLGLIGAAFYIGSKISDYTINAFYSWSIKWTLFILSLVFTGLYMEAAFIPAMLLYILINSTTNPMMFASKQELTT